MCQAVLGSFDSCFVQKTAHCLVGCCRTVNAVLVMGMYNAVQTTAMDVSLNVNCTCSTCYNQLARTQLLLEQNAKILHISVHACWQLPRCN